MLNNIFSSLYLTFIIFFLVGPAIADTASAFDRTVASAAFEVGLIEDCLASRLPERPKDCCILVGGWGSVGFASFVRLAR